MIRNLAIGHSTAEQDATVTMDYLASAGDRLQAAVLRHADHCADADGVVQTQVPGFRMMRTHHRQGPMRSIYRPLICLVLQGAKSMQVGHEERTLRAGQAIIVAAHLPVTGHVVEASPQLPYVAVSIELDLALLHTLAIEIGELPGTSQVPVPVFLEGIDVAAVQRGQRHGSFVMGICHQFALAPNAATWPIVAQENGTAMPKPR